MPTDRKPVMRNEPPLRPEAAANSQLRFIREMMERTSEFTAVPGWGGIVMGATALIAAVVAWQAESVVTWMRIWAAEALVGFIIGAFAISWKARAHRVPLLSGQGRKFLLCLGPAIAAGAALTVAIYSIDVMGMSEYAASAPAAAESISMRLLPGTWLLLYGAGVVAAGIFSVRPVPILGAMVMAAGFLALLTPPALGDLWMGIGFGILHIVFGAVIARKYGG
jgi:hypothetical protein